MIYLIIFGLNPSATVTPSLSECLAVGKVIIGGRQSGTIACYDAKNNILTPVKNKGDE